MLYASMEGRVALVLLASIATNYLAVSWLGARRGVLPRKFVLCLGIAANTGLLLAFKYSAFLAGSLNRVLVFLHQKPTSLPGLLVPMGISFFTFRALSYLIDAYREPQLSHRGVVEVGLYISFFPQLLAGPIARFQQMEQGIRNPQLTVAGFASGARRFCVGLGKKVLVADVIAANADRIFGLDPATLPHTLAWLGAAAFMLQILFDFSGYTDMAIGLSQMLGFSCPENFAAPYWSRSIREFWRRWHMTLSSWLRDYIYIPLGGSRRGAARTYGNLILVFLVCGLWHGSGWVFVAWGLYHGCLMVVERLGVLRWLTDRWRLPGHAYALLAIMVGWVIFRSPSLGSAVRYLAAMFGASARVTNAIPSAWLLDPQFVTAMVVGTLLCVPWRSVATCWASRLAHRFPIIQRAGRALGALAPVGANLGAIALLAMSILRIAGGTHHPFIYSQF